MPASSNTLNGNHATYQQNSWSKCKGHQEKPAPPQRKHFEFVQQQHARLRSLICQDVRSQPVISDGFSLSIGDLVGVSCHQVECRMTTDPAILDTVDASVKLLSDLLDKGSTVYGITTGFGGSADSRTKRYESLQKSLLQHHHVGILLPSDVEPVDVHGASQLTSLSSHALPRTVVRASLLIRCNTLLRGHSAVRKETIEAALKLLNCDFLPVIPLRGSISASGDLTPLSYIAGALEGNPGIFVDCTVKSGRKILPANEALKLAEISPIVLGAKEGLGIMNGTAVSCAAATLAINEANYLALLVQAMTGMCTEALQGAEENYHPFIASCRPHPGQIEAAANITHFLRGSKFTASYDSAQHVTGLFQDRYALRTASQWIAPQLEDLTLAAQQLEVELNSTTDNPIFDPLAKEVHHGGNFQATSVTSATEKTRSSLQMLGRLIFGQSSEVINPMLNKSLPGNLTFDDPSLSFTFKGVDINMAAYMSELGYLANPVSSHVQSAEMHNQAVNSLAMISARYTLDAVEVVSLMAALHLYILCQALDLRAMHDRYMQEISYRVKQTLLDVFSPFGATEMLKNSAGQVLDTIEKTLAAEKSQDLPARARACADATSLLFLSHEIGWQQESDYPSSTKAQLLPALALWRQQCEEIVTSAVSATREHFAMSAPSITPEYLSHGSKVLYNFIRKDLGVGLHKGIVEHATHLEANSEGITVPPSDKKLIGTEMGTIYASIRSGRIHDAIIESLK